jgi:hypothetical protein
MGWKRKIDKSGRRRKITNKTGWRRKIADKTGWKNIADKTGFEIPQLQLPTEGQSCFPSPKRQTGSETHPDSPPLIIRNTETDKSTTEKNGISDATKHTIYPTPRNMYK